MIAGHCAFVGDTIPTVLYQLVHVEPPPLLINGQPVSPALDAVIRRGLAKQPEARFPNVLDFSHAFSAAIAERASAALSTNARLADAPQPAARARVTEAAGSPKAAETPFGLSALPTSAIPARPDKPRGFRWAIAAGGIVVAVGASALVLSLKACTPASAPPAASAPPPIAAPPPAPAPAPVAEQISVEVQDAPANLKVSIDGGELRTLPVRLVKGSGAHQMVFQAPGYRAKTVQIDAGKDIMLGLSMKKLARSQPVVEKPAQSQPVVERAESPVEEPAPSKPGRFKRSFNAVKRVWLGD
jgi:serine/threonine-protein kinase